MPKKERKRKCANCKYRIVERGCISYCTKNGEHRLLNFAETLCGWCRNWAKKQKEIHAHWIPKKEMIRSPEAKNYNCSACGKESFAYPNCPFCRAIMDEEAKDDDRIQIAV